MKVFICIVSLLLLCVYVHAGEVTYKINSDNSVTFSIELSSAKNVYITGSFITPKVKFKHHELIITKRNPIKMKRSGNTWTYTTAPLESEMYTYKYIVDKKEFLDSNNTNVVRDIDEHFNYFFIPGAVASRYQDCDILHGSVEKIWYPSTLNGMSQRRMFVYLPAGYYQNQEKKYPVLYLLHGSGGDETSWTDYGRASQILDNMIASGDAVPMIVVMPNENINLDAAPGESPYMERSPSGMNASSMLGKAEKAFVPEIVKYIDLKYRTYNDKQHRAIAGLSLGGLHTIFITANNPSCFDYVGLFSAQTTNLLDSNRNYYLRKLNWRLQTIKDAFSILSGNVPSNTNLSERLEDIDIYDNIEEKLRQQFIQNPQLYYIAVGRDDFVKKLNDDYRKKLDASGYSYIYNETDGGHTWENWRKYLVDFLPRLFN